MRRLAGRGWARRRLAAAAALAAVVVIAATGCQVRTDVRVSTNPNGSGTVAVTVTLDRAADQAIGGLAQQLQTDGLAAQGWTVGSPTPVGGGGESVTASHPFSGSAQMSAIVESIAGTGTSHPFQLALTHRHTLWRDQSTLSGRVDLTCGVACFGDQALAGLTGSAVGFDANALAGKAGVTPAQALRFDVTVAIPGSVRRTDATSRPAGQLEWQPQLGQLMVIDATTSQLNTGPVVAAVVAVAVVAVLLVALIVVLWRRRRGRRHATKAHSRAAGVPPDPDPAPAAKETS